MNIADLHRLQIRLEQLAVRLAQIIGLDQTGVLFLGVATRLLQNSVGAAATATLLRSSADSTERIAAEVPPQRAN